MANNEVEVRSDYFGVPKVIDSEIKRLGDMKKEIGSWTGVKEALENGDVPYFKSDEHNISDVYDAGSADGCPVTKRLLEEEKIDPTVLINLYVTRHRAGRMISRLLKESGNINLLELWKGNEERRPEEKRVDYALAGTPSRVLEMGNPHMGAAKYENFAICQFFRRLTDAEVGIEGPVKNLPKNIKLYPKRNEFIDDARKAESLNDLNNRIVSTLVPIMVERGVNYKQTSDLLLDCLLSEPLLIEDNCWERAENASFGLADYLIQSDIKDNQEVGMIFKEGIKPTISSFKGI